MSACEKQKITNPVEEMSQKAGCMELQLKARVGTIAK